MHRFVIIFAAIVLCAQMLNAVDTATATNDLDTIRTYIDQLGADDYETREYAERQLGRIGYQAFEPLRESQEHNDIEIRYRVRRLLHNLRGKLIVGEVGDKILKDYHAKATAYRIQVIDHLSMVAPEKGVPSLCRLARFEESERVSKLAALTVIDILQQLPKENLNDSKAQYLETVKQSLGASERAAANWLRVYSESLVNPAANVDAWKEISNVEKRLFQQASDKTSEFIFHGTIRTHAMMLIAAERSDDALDLVDSQLNTPAQILELNEMFLREKMWDVVDKQIERHQEKFDTDRLLAYRKAEFLRARDGDEAGKKAADAAFELGKRNNPKTGSPLDSRKIVSNQIWASFPKSGATLHLVTGLSLSNRGMHDWGEREYRTAIAASKVGDIVDARSRYLLSEMLHDSGDHLGGGEILKPLVEVLFLKKDATARRNVARLEHTVNETKSRMHFFFARDFIKKQDYEAARKELEEGNAIEPTDSDVLIWMYRLPNQDDEWKKATVRKIEKASADFARKISKYEALMKSSSSSLSSYPRTLIDNLNQYAWLVGNTVGDTKEAIRHSQRSLEIRPGSAGFLDTLARCYYRDGRIDEAIDIQQQALRRDPFSGQLKDQLQLFLDAKSKADQETEAP